ncbi:hypothetical protein OJAV_G00129370 [Oryzias javanicus]|uniref:Uncharacterized protein n=1 Tax=Oryzias javanicus TaxID=123683 RepID=A0A437CPQ2_ORYJA|nr:hypothetical protein OJAV_G00129370 [Oryzias javanicus]
MKDKLPELDEEEELSREVGETETGDHVRANDIALVRPHSRIVTGYFKDPDLLCFQSNRRPKPSAPVTCWNQSLILLKRISSIT